MATRPVYPAQVFLPISDPFEHLQTCAHFCLETPHFSTHGLCKTELSSLGLIPPYFCLSFCSPTNASLCFHLTGLVKNDHCFTCASQKCPSLSLPLTSDPIEVEQSSGICSLFKPYCRTRLFPSQVTTATL